MIALAFYACFAESEPLTVEDPCISPVVLAAADLQYALTELASLYERSAGCAPLLAFGSTGAFTAQIEQGAQADLFFAADRSFVDRLASRSLVRPETTTVYALGRIVLVAPRGREPPPSLGALGDPSIRFVAIANPEHAPYGMAAERALRAAGAYDAVAPKLVLGENIAQAWQLVETGNADAGIVALSVALSRDDVGYTLIDESMHERIVQAAAVPTAAVHPKEGAAFLAFVTSEPGLAVLARYGFALPGQ